MATGRTGSEANGMAEQQQATNEASSVVNHPLSDYFARVSSNQARPTIEYVEQLVILLKTQGIQRYSDGRIEIVFQQLGQNVSSSPFREDYRGKV